MLVGLLIAILLGLISMLIFVFSPLYGFAYLVAWYGRKRQIFQLPSADKRIRLFQSMCLTLLAAVLLANLAARWNILNACFYAEPALCPRHASQEIIGIPLIPDTLADWEAIIKYLIPHFMRETCYVGNEFACTAASNYMIDQMDRNLAPYPSIWLFAVAHALAVLAIMHRVFPDQRKQKRR